MKKKSIIPVVFLLSVMLVSAMSCSLLFSDDDKKPAEDPGGNNPGGSTDERKTIDDLIGSVSASLAGKGLYTEAEVSAIRQGAAAAVNAEPAAESGKNNTETHEYEKFIPVASAGSFGALEGFTSWDDNKRIACVEHISAAYVASLSGLMVETGGASSLRNATGSRATSSGSGAAGIILARISKAAVENLARTGITAGRRGEAAGAVVGTMIGSLGSGGINKAIVNDAVAKITASAVENLKASGLSESAALTAAVSSITKGAVAAVSAITVEGVGAADLSSLAGSVTKSAAASAGALASNPQEAANLSSSAATGAADGVAQILGGNASLGAEATAALVRGVVMSATEGSLDNGWIDPSLNGTAVVTAVTSAVSKQFAASVSVGETVALAEVTKGAAAAITAAAAKGGFESAELLGAITLKNAADANVAVVQSNVDAGVAIGTNTAPVAVPGENISVTVGTEVSVDGSASSDKEDSGAVPPKPLSFLWSFISKPSAENALFDGDSGKVSTVQAAQASFTPSVEGVYILSLKVTDSKGLSTEAYVTVTVVKDAGSSVWGGKTASERLEGAKQLFGAGDFMASRDEALILLTRYPEGGYTIPGKLILGQSYLKLGAYDFALIRFVEVIESEPSLEERAQANLGRGWASLNQKAFDNAINAFSKAKTDGAGTSVAAEAARGLGLCYLKTNQIPKARDHFLEAQNDPASSVKTRWNAQRDLAESWFNAGNIDTAIAEAGKLRTEKKYTWESEADWSDPSKQNMKLVYDTDMLFGEAYMMLQNSDPEYKVALEALFAAILSNDKYSAAQHLNTAKRFAEYKLWTAGGTKADCEAARDALVAALGEIGAADIGERHSRSWAQLRLGQTYNNLVGFALDGEKAGLIANAHAAFDAASSTLPYWWGHTSAAESVGQKAGLLIWTQRKYAAAETLLSGFISAYPAERDRYPLAFAWDRLSQAYIEMGYDAKKRYGKDYEQYFLKALSAASKCRSENFPELDPDAWYFQEATQNSARIYAELGQLVRAREILTGALSKTGTDAGRKPWLQLELAKTFASEAMWQAGNGEFSSALGTAGTAGAEFEKVMSEFNGDAVENGNPSVDALTELGNMYREIGRRMDDHGYYNIDTEHYNTVVATYGKAVAAYERITDAAYGNAQPSRWGFYARYADCADALLGMRRWADARTKLDGLLAMENLEALFGAKRRLEALRDYAYTYRREAELTDTWNDELGQRIPENCAIVLDRIPRAVSKYKEVFAIDKKADDGANAARAIVDICWSYNRLMDGALYTADPRTAIAGYIGDARTLINAAGSFCAADGVTLLESGRFKGDAFRAFASMLRNSAWLVYDWTPQTDTGRIAVRKAALEDAISYYDKAVAIPDISIDAALDSRISTAECLWDLLAISVYEEAGAGAADYFDRCRNLAESVIADSPSEARYVARAARVLGYIHMRFGHDLIGKVEDIDKDSDWRDVAISWFKFVLDNENYRNSDGGWIGEDCRNGLDSWELKVDYDIPGLSFVNLLKADSAWHMVSASGSDALLYIAVPEAGSYSLYLSDADAGIFPGATDVTVSVVDANGAVILAETDTAFSAAAGLSLPAGKSFVRVKADAGSTVSCRLKLVKN